MTGTYIVAAIHDWNKNAFDDNVSTLPGVWQFVSDKQSLNLEFIKKTKPDYIFFPHWSWKVPKEILESAECVCFHMTDVPYGRGGSPLQNLISRGHKETKLTALQMVEAMDAGPVYMKIPLALDGTAETIYKAAAQLVYQMIRTIISDKITPKPQEGEPTLFARRTPDMSEIPKNIDIFGIYDHIRMLDAPGYPKAFIRHGEHEFKFDNAKLTTIDGQDTIVANITITLGKQQDKS